MKYRPENERFWEKVNKDGPISHLGSACWQWTATPDKSGYGKFRGERRGRSWLAHRYAWVQENGPVPDGLTLDHLCRNRLCVRPDHLEPTTRSENISRSYRHDYGYIMNGLVSCHA